MESTLAPDRTIVIPEEICERLHLEPGDRIDWAVSVDGKLVGEPAAQESATDEREPIEVVLRRWQGTGPSLGTSVDEFIEETRGR
ncbi:MAG: AbrB/MazE/SpoVT family DNA-binding domain-containing protein [Dehalococcoidia bacterium]